MPILKNAKHEAFAQEIFKGLSAHYAYEKAGYKPSRSAASRLSTNVNISARLVELQGKAAERAATTVEDIATQLDEDREFARKEGSPAAAVTATMGKAKVLGLIVDRNEVTGKGGGPIEMNEVSARELVSRRISGLAARATKRSGSSKSE